MVENRLSSEAHNDALAHTHVCATCRAELERIRQVTTIMRRDASVDAPSHIIHRAIDIFRAPQTHGAIIPKPSRVRRLLAELNFDSLGMSPAHGLRSASAALSVGDSRQMLFGVGEIDLDLRATQTEDGSWMLDGQILGAPDAQSEAQSNGVVVLQRTGSAPDGVTSEASATLDELYEFHLSTVASGTYRLTITVGETEIEIPEFSLS